MANGTGTTNFMDNEGVRLLMSMMLQGGGELSGSPAIKGIGAVGNQFLAAQSMKSQQKEKYKWLSDLLNGGGKMSLDAENISIKAPAKSLSMNEVGEGSLPGAGAVAKPEQALPAATGGTSQGIDPKVLMAILGGVGQGPTESPAGGSSASLVGLTPQDLSLALEGATRAKTLEANIADALAGRELKGRELDILDSYRKASVDVDSYKATTDRVSELRKLAESVREAPLSVPGLGKVDLETWKSLDTKTKAYSYYAFDAQQNGEKPMPYNEWDQQTDDPTAKQLYDLAVDDPDFNEWLTKYRQSGATRITIGEKVETAEALADVKAVKYFTDPEGLTADIDKHMKSEEVQNKLFQFADKPREQTKQTIVEKGKFIETKIKGAGGKISGARMEGRTRVWTVKWPNGKITEVSYGF